MGKQQASKIYKTKRKTRDLDQILNDDMKSKASIDLLENQKFDEYLPGLGQNYCVPCAKHFETGVALSTHSRQKVHKRQLRNLRFGPYTSEEAHAGAGQDVHKYLAKQQNQKAIASQPDTSERLVPKKQQKHKKLAQELCNNEMNVESQDLPAHEDIAVESEKPVEEEISV